MLRRTFFICCPNFALNSNSRVGIFPLHLDPPTLQHRELFRLLVGEGKKETTLTDDHITDLWCFDSFRESMKTSALLPFEHLILLPNTRYPVALRLSTHLAALTVLASRGLPRVHVDFTALEHPDEDMPCIRELTQKYKNSTLVHWLHDAHEMHKWSHFSDLKLDVPMLLLQTLSLSVEKAGKSRLALENGFAHEDGTDTHTRTPVDPVGEDEVEISRSYLCSSAVSWLASSPVNDISPALRPFPGSSGISTNQGSLGNGSSSSSSSNDDGCGISNGKKKDDEISPGEGGVHGEGGGTIHRKDGNHHYSGGYDSVHSAPDRGGHCSDQTHTPGATTNRNHPIDSRPNPHDPPKLSHEALSASPAFSDGLDEAWGEETHSLTPESGVPVRRKVRHLVEELLAPDQPHRQVWSDSQPAPPVARVEVHPILRCTGADVRQALWEREGDPSSLLTEPVNRYIASHGLYRDYRKGYSAKISNAAAVSAAGGKGRKLKVPSSGFVPSLSFAGLIPRLELHYDKNNLLAREHYERLQMFQPRDGEEPDLIVPIGGDGYMMHCIRNNWNRFIPFFGVNAGHVGYLLNDPSMLDELFFAPLKLHSTTMLYCLAEKETATGEKVLLSELAFNDAWVERSSGQTALIRILVNGEERIRMFRGDGVLVSTAAGSTAYCQALGASPVPVGAPLIQVVGSNVVSPAQWRPTHLNQEDQVELEVIDSFKRPCRCFVDSVDVGNVTRMLVRSSRAAGVVIAFANSCDLQQKLYQMQFPTTE